MSTIGCEAGIPINWVSKYLVFVYLVRFYLGLVFGSSHSPVFVFGICISQNPLIAFGIWVGYGTFRRQLFGEQE